MKFLLFSLVAASLLTGCAGPGPEEHAANTAPAGAKRQAAQQPLVLDVRSAEEYESEHLPGTVNLPVSDLEAKIKTVAPDKETPILVHCQGGGRSARAAKTLQRLGYTNVRDLGSFDAAKAELSKR